MLLDPLPAPALAVARIVHSVLQADRCWPIVDYVDGLLRRDGIRLDVALAGVPSIGSAGYSPIWVESGVGALQPNSKVGLTVAGLAQIADAGETVEAVLRMVEGMADELAHLDPDPRSPRQLRLRWAELAGYVIGDTHTGDAHTVNRALRVLALEPPGWGCGQLGFEPSEATWEPSTRIVDEFAGVAGVTDYLHRVERFFEPIVAPLSLVSLQPVRTPEQPTTVLFADVVDPELWEAIGALVIQDQWDAAALKAVVFFEHRVRAACGAARRDTGARLMNIAFQKEDGKIPLGPADDEDTRAGFHLLALGLFRGVRNTIAHTVPDSVDRRRAAGAIGTVTLLMSQMRADHPHLFDDAEGLGE